MVGHASAGRGTCCRGGVDVDDALDYSAALYNADVFLLLTQERGCTPEQVERWWIETLAQLLLQ